MELKERILAHSMELFLRYGIKSITMDDIARENGISKKTLYQLVENKADMIRKLIHGYIMEEKKIIGEIRTEARDAIDEMLKIARYVTQMLRKLGPTTVYDLKKYYRGTWEMMESLHQQYIYSIIKENIEKGIKQKLYRKNLDQDTVAKMYVGLTFLVVDDKLFPNRSYNREKLYWEFIRYHIHGIASDKGLELLKKYAAANVAQKNMP